MKSINSYPELLNILLSKWYYLLIGTGGALLAAYLFLQICTPEYRADASLKVEERKSELSELISLRNLYDRTSKVESEKTVIRSRAVLTKAIAALNCRVTYFKTRHFNLYSTYPNQLLAIRIIQQDNNAELGLIKFEFLTPKTFILTYDNALKKKLIRKFNYGETIHLPGVSFQINSSPALKNRTCFFRFNQSDGLVKLIRESLRITDNQNTNILELSFTDDNPRFAKDVMNAILMAYQEYDKLQRILSNQQTSLFIDTLLEKMSALIQTSGIKIAQFKRTHQMLSLSSTTEELLQQMTALETEKQTLMIRHFSSLHLEKTLQANSHLQKFNNELQGVEDPQLLVLLNKLNEQLEKRTQAILLYQQSSPVICHIDERIGETKHAILNNVKSQLKKEEELLAHFNTEIGRLKAQMQNIPKTERDNIQLQSVFNVEQKMYDYLSEKKFETQISTAAVVSRVQLIDIAALPKEPIYPIKADIYTDFSITGLLIGILSIFIQRRINPYLYDISTAETQTSIPIIGLIRNHPFSKKNTYIPSIESPRTLFSESIRNLRASLSFVASEKTSKIICITSEIAGEGKSFCALNLAGVFSLADKKVVVIAADLRKSALHKAFETNNQHGLSSYLAGQTALDQICIQTSHNNLWFISSGPIPPNPSELLQSKKMQGLLLQLKSSFDYIILDSAPAGLVSDAIPLMKLADINLFMLRHGVSRRYAAALPEKLQKDAQLQHVYLVMNSFEKNRFQTSYHSPVPGKRYHNDYYDK